MKKIAYILSIFLVLICGMSISVLKSSVAIIEEFAIPTLASIEIPKSSSYINLDKLPAEYYPQLAKGNGDVVGLHGIGYNVKKLENFVDAFKRKSLNIGDMIRITSYTIEGDAVIQDLSISSDGAKLIVDNTRDKYSQPSDRIKRYYNIVDIKIEKRDNKTFYRVITDKGEERPLVTFMDEYMN